MALLKCLERHAPDAKCCGACSSRTADLDVIQRPRRVGQVLLAAEDGVLSAGVLEALEEGVNHALAAVDVLLRQQSNRQSSTDHQCLHPAVDWLAVRQLASSQINTSETDDSGGLGWIRQVHNSKWCRAQAGGATHICCGA